MVGSHWARVHWIQKGTAAFLLGGEQGTDEGSETMKEEEAGERGLWGGQTWPGSDDFAKAI